jgi:hypothetical protein
MADYFIGYYKATLDYLKTNKWVLVALFGISGNIGQGLILYSQTKTKQEKPTVDCVELMKKHIQEYH